MFLTTQQFADLLEVSPARVRQMVTEGRLPRPLAFGPRMYLFPRAAVDAYLSEETTSVIAAQLPPIERPLQLKFDVVHRYRREPTKDSHPIHVRIYEGEGRVVCLLACLEGYSVLTGHGSYIAPEVARRWLPEHDMSEITWVTLEDNGTPPFGQASTEITNLVLTQVRGGSPIAHWSPSWVDMTWAQVRTLVGGAAIDVYDWDAYTEDTVTSWQRSGKPVPIRHDPQGLEPLALALDQLRPLKVPQSLPAKAAAEQALVVQLRLRSTGTPYMPMRSGEPEPTPNTTVRVPYALPDHLTEVIADQNLEVLPSFKQSAKNVDLLHEWRETVDEFSDEPKPAITALIDTAITASEDLLMLTHPENNPPAFVPAHHLRTATWTQGPWQKQYLEECTWGDPTPPLSTRERRLLESQRPQGEGWTVQLGRDYDDNAIMLLDHERTKRNEHDHFVVLWPKTYRHHPLPDGVQLVSEGDAGDMPVFVSRRGRILGLLPRAAGSGQWNFGYAGGGPGQLARDIASFLEEDGCALTLEDRSWIRREVTTSSQQSLRIDLSSFLASRQ